MVRHAMMPLRVGLAIAAIRPTHFQLLNYHPSSIQTFLREP